MTPAEIATIVVRLDQHGEQLDRIEQHVRHTNGRVTELERERIAREAAAAALAQAKAGDRQRRAWMPPAAVSIWIFVAGIAAERLL